jgi:DNA-binding beta-propeller fold protein YncE
LDVGRDILYVASGNSIVVFDAASTRDGAVVPNRTITGGATQLSSPEGIYIDSSNNFLYVANSGANSVLVFNNAGKAEGNIPPSRAIAQGTHPIDETTLSFPVGIFDTTR